MTGAAESRPTNQPDKTQLQKNYQSIVFVQLAKPRRIQRNCDDALLFITGPEKIHRAANLNSTPME